MHGPYECSLSGSHLGVISFLWPLHPVTPSIRIYPAFLTISPCAEGILRVNNPSDLGRDSDSIFRTILRTQETKARIALPLDGVVTSLRPQRSSHPTLENMLLGSICYLSAD